jgi:ribose/xylose/arabinose/galactoside ABC-type transport system permease subunit
MSTATKAPTQTKDAPSSRPLAIREKLTYTQERAMTVILLILILIFSQTASAFFTRDNIQNIGSSSAYFAIVGVGMTVLFIVGEFDLSLGAIYGITATVIAVANTNDYTTMSSLLIGVAAALAIGLANGFFSTLGRVPSFIVTIGMLSVLQGMAQYLSGGQPVTLTTATQNSWLATVAQGKVAGLSAQLIMAIIVFLGTAFLLRKTRLGAHLYLTGGNPKASKQVGINTNRVKLFAFVFAAFLAALCGTMQVFQLGTAQPGAGQGSFLFLAVGAAIIGGVSLTGGEGSVYGTLIGAAILAVLNNGLVLSGVDPGLGVTITGALIILAGLLQAGMREFLASLFRRTKARQRSQAKAA